MIKEIFEKIINNKTNFSKEEKELLDTYVQKSYLKQDNNKYILSKKYRVGLLNINGDFAKILSLANDKKTIKIDDTKAYNNGDFILVQVIFNPRGTLKAKIIDVLESNQQSTLCYIHNNSLYDVKSLSKISMQVDIKDYKQDDVVYIKDASILEKIGSLQESNIDEKISLYLYDESYRLETYTTKIKKIDDYSNRVDLRDLEFCTIDPASAKDHDDAIYYDAEEKELYVAIADVSSFVKEGSILDEQARKRAFSIYLPNKVLPMIPHVLSDDLCSLKPHVDRLAFVCKMKIDSKNLKVTHAQIFEAVINSKHKYSYEEIDEKIKNKKLPTQLDALYALSIKLRTKRLKNGYDFRTSQYRLQLDENLHLKYVTQEHSSASHHLVEECMLLANINAAKKLDGLGIFRVHEEPKRSKIDDLLKNVALLGIDLKLKKDIHSTIESLQQKAKNISLEEEVDTLIIQSQQQASYSSVQAGHFGLGFTHYSHFTSPIRRYSDLVLHRILKNKKIPKDIDDICEHISTKERQIAKLVWDLEDRIYARYASRNIDNTYEAIICDLGENPQVELTGKFAGLTANIENYKGEKLFAKVKIQITKSDIIAKKILGKLV
jgi:ribonuclease R